MTTALVATGTTFTKAMATAGINSRTIAQGSSERQISICVEAADCAKALALSSTQDPNLSSTQISVAVLDATGAVGSEFLEQLVESKKLLTDPSVAGKRKAQHRLQGDLILLTTNPDPNPSPDHNPNPDPNPNPSLDPNPNPFKVIGVAPLLQRHRPHGQRARRERDGRPQEVDR
eukprot:scaffold17801_cov63-Phaeocystis_antarctica.AAC.7